MICHIVGAGAHGLVVADILASRSMPIAGFLDDNPGLRGRQVHGYPVLGDIQSLLVAGRREPLSLIVALGAAPIRLRLVRDLLQAGHVLVNAVHQSAVLSPSAQLGRGVCVCAAAVLNPDAAIGDAAIINTGATVDHHCRIAEGAHLSPGVHLAGRVSIGPLSFLGVGVSVAPRLSIGAGAIIGAGSVVVEDIPDDVLVYGVPARVVRRLHGQFDWSRLL